MVLRPELFVTGIGGNVQHVFDPVRAIRHLDLVPVEPIILESAMPVELEAEQIAVELIFCSHVLYDKTGVKKLCAELRPGRKIINRIRERLDEGYAGAFWVADLK